MALKETEPDLFPLGTFEALRRLNPHWEGRPGPLIPSYRRSAFSTIYRKLQNGLAPAVVLRGPRRVGKTVLLRQIINQLIADGVAPGRILYVPFDDIPSLTGGSDPVLAIAHWFEDRVLGESFNEAAAAGRPAILFFDEVQNLDDWATQIKHLVDNFSVRGVVTGSSSLRIELGRDSLAGRVSTVEIGPLLLREIAELRGFGSFPAIWPGQGSAPLKSVEFWRDAVARSIADAGPRQRAFATFSERGAYPIAHDNPDADIAELSSFLNETVVKRAIQHDLRQGERGRKRDERLLEEVFRLGCRYAGQAPAQAAYTKGLQEVLEANIGWVRILTYLKFLDKTLLLRLIEPLEMRLRRRKGAPKLCLCDHMLRASWLGETVPLDPDQLETNAHLSDLAGRIAESTAGFLASCPEINTTWMPARDGEPEVDFVVTVGDQRIPVEVKYQRRIDPLRDTEGLRRFLDRPVNNAPFGLLVTQRDGVEAADPRIVAMSLSSLLWMR